jgi:hypothetical protein
MAAPQITVWKYFTRVAGGKFDFYYKDKSKIEPFLKLVQRGLAGEGWRVDLKFLRKEFKSFMKSIPEKGSLNHIYNLVKDC